MGPMGLRWFVSGCINQDTGNMEWCMDNGWRVGYGVVFVLYDTPWDNECE